MGCGAVLGFVLGLTATAGADGYPYRYRTPSGALILANAPLESATHFFIIRRQRTRPPAPRMLLPDAHTGLLSEQMRSVPGPSSTSYDGLVREIAGRYAVEYELVKAVIKAESDFNRLAVSLKGARGLMQLMPETAALHMVRDVFVPRDNIEGGCRHLRMLLDHYRGSLPLAVAAYSAGTRRVEEAGGIPPIPETREYVARVLRYRQAYLRERGNVLALRR